MDDNQKKVLSRLQAQCSKREYCLKDVRDKALKALEGDTEAASAIVNALADDGFVPDGCL